MLTDEKPIRFAGNTGHRSHGSPENGDYEQLPD